MVEASGLDALEDPLLEISFLRQSRSASRGFSLAVAALAQCGEDAPLPLLAELIEAIEDFNQGLAAAAVELPKLRQAVEEDPDNGEKLANLGFNLNAVDERDAALAAFTRALEHPDSLCIHCHRDCLNNIGWDHYMRGEYEQALGWFEHACRLGDLETKALSHLDARGLDRPNVPYRLALENILLTLAKLGRLTEATERLQQYHNWFGRVPSYEALALQKLGLQPDVVFIRSRARKPADEISTD